MNQPNAEEISTITSVYPLGCLAGCILISVIGMRLGRRLSIVLGCALIVIGGSLQAGSVSQAMIIVSRVIAGAGTGMTSTCIPMWISETSPAKTRGRDVALQLLLVLSGNVTAYWFDYGMIIHHTGQVVWRFPVAFQCFYALLGGLIILFLPESPRVLYGWQRVKEADDTLLRLLDCTPNDESFIVGRQEILDAMEMESNQEEGQSLWRSLLWDTSKVNNSRLVDLQLQAITYYQTTLMSDAIGLDAHMASLMGVSYNVNTLFLGTFPPVLLIERLGRRLLLIGGAVGTSLAMIAFTVAVKYAPGNPAVGWFGVSMIFLYEFIFACSWNCVVWVYAPEISPFKFRHINTAAGVATEWLFTFVTVKITPIGIASLGWRFFIIFVVFNVLQAVFAYFFCPETKGATLEEIDYMFCRTGLLEEPVEEIIDPTQTLATEQKGTSNDEVGQI
ncbi:hypothetical protein I204_02928 [Kwoniella mangroviensis CBS 8886]|nr:hypothetical protein I204_02928 [Kwoniella mangroviensis CBS 8886]